jgi:hypothetical protein
MYINVIEWCKLPTEFENISLFCTMFLFSYYIFLLMHILCPFFWKC